MNPYTKGKVTILVPTYNQERYIGEAIESILSQTYSNFEALILDDASTDGAAEVIRRYAASDSRIIPLIADKNLGFSANMNRGFGLVTGEFTAKLDGDDMMLPQRLEKQVKFLNENPGTVLCHADMEIFDNATGKKIRNMSDDAPLAEHPLDWALYRDWFFIRKHPTFSYTTLLARSEYLLRNKWDPSVPYKNEVLQVVENYAAFPQGKWHAMKEVVCCYRWMESSMSRNKKPPLFFIEEAERTYSIALDHCPQLSRTIKSSFDFYMFNQLLYNWVPAGTYRQYLAQFFRQAGWVKGIYLLFCRLLLKANLFYPFFSVVRKIAA